MQSGQACAMFCEMAYCHLRWEGRRVLVKFDWTCVVRDAHMMGHTGVTKQKGNGDVKLLKRMGNK